MAVSAGGHVVTAELLTFLVALATVGLIATWWCVRRRGEQAEDVWLPDELRSARLAYAERLFRSKGPLQISARVDRAYRDRSGYLTLVELKTRDLDEVYPSDVIEMSAQRTALAAATGEIVSKVAYVLVQGTDGRSRRVHRVDLLTAGQVGALAARRQALLSGAIQARSICMDGICGYCVFAGPCRGRR